ncbi:MAG: AAA family ATPase, partial [Euzebyaceae bacterium]|nr:AAA family ATPase [Euzebyaceae bacterium]
LLHSHVLVANVGQAVDDGRWRTLDARQLYRHAKTAGYLYQAQLRHELTRALGVEWLPVVHGCADIDGVPRVVVVAFSQRRVEIEARMAQRGESSAKAAQVATLDTRRAKGDAGDQATLRRNWRSRAAALGFTARDVSLLLGRSVPLPLDAAEASRIVGELAGPSGLSAQASSFTATDVLQACCQRLPAGAAVEEVEALAAAVLDPAAGVAVRLLDPDTATTGDVIRRGDGRLVPVPDNVRYSTPQLLALEADMLARAVARRDAGVGMVDRDIVDRVLVERSSLSGEQREMVAALTTSGAGVEVVVGKAGAGKTYALDAARAAWQTAGHTVIGCALAARAAAELEAGAGVDSYTVAGLLADVERAGASRWLGASTVVVVDEAGMVGTRTLARLLGHAETVGAKVVLVGDHRQLPEIDAGGGFRGLAARLDAIQLVDNRRQGAVWERAALNELRDGNPSVALAAYTAHARIVVADNADVCREQLVSDWWAATADQLDARDVTAGVGTVGVMVAARRSDVDDLNERARRRLAATGRLTGPAVTDSGGRDFQSGDQVMALRNDRRLGVINGSRGTATAVDSDQRSVTVRLTDHRQVILPAGYLDAGHLTHGYAITGHKAQGLTTDQAWVLGSDNLYREWGYVAMSRARHSTRLYLVDHRGNNHTRVLPRRRLSIQPGSGQPALHAPRGSRGSPQHRHPR